MGKYGYGPGLGGNASIASSGPAIETYSTGGSTPSPGTFQPRGFPERVSPEMAMPEGMDTMEFIDKAVIRGPAYVYERPIAAVSAMLGMKQDESILDPVANFFQDLPVVGEHLSNAGKLAENAFFASQGTLNAPVAAAFDLITTEKLGDNDQLPPHYSMWFTGLPGMTVRDFRKKAKEYGWSNQDAAQIASGERGWLDFPEKSISTDPTADLVYKLLLDPLNVALVGTPLVIGKLGLMGAGGVLKGGRAAAQAALVQSSTKLTMPLTKLPALPKLESASAIMAGQAHRATTAGFAEVLKNLASNSVKYSVKHPLSAYRRVAVGTTGAQIGVNSVAAMSGENGPLADVLRPLYEAAASLGERKPLSENDLFALGSLFTFPARGMASQGVRNVSVQIGKRRRFSFDRAVLKSIYPDMPFDAAWKAAVARTGSEASVNAFMEQILKHAVHTKNYMEGVAGFISRHSYGSLSEAGYGIGMQIQSMNIAIRNMLESGALRNTDIVKAMQDFAAGRGHVVSDLTSGVKKQWFDPDDIWLAWERYEPFAQQLAEVFPNGSPIVPGIVTDVVLDSGVDWAKYMVNLGAKDGTIGLRELHEIIRQQPAILGVPGGEKLGVIMTADAARDALRLPVKDVQKLLDEARTHARSRAEYFAPQETRELIAMERETATKRTQQLFNTDGTIDPRIDPAGSQADLIVMTAQAKRGRTALVSQAGSYTDNVGTLRANPKTALVEFETTFGLSLGGLEPLSVSQVGLLERGSTKSTTVWSNTGVAARMPEHLPMSDLMDAAALSLESSGAGRATVVIRGAALVDSKGLARNAIEYTWDVGRKTNAEWDELASLLERFGDRVVVHDQRGLVRVIVPDGRDMQKALTAAEKKMGTPTQEVAHIRDIVNKKKVNANADPAGSITLEAAINDAKSKRGNRYFAIRSYIDVGLRPLEPSGAISVASRSDFAKLARAKRRTGGADRPATGPRPTRWQQSMGGGIRRGASKHEMVVDDAVRAEYQAKLRTAGVRDTNPLQPFTFREGDKLFRTADTNAGAVVRVDGELVPWVAVSKAGRRFKLSDDWDSVLNDASELATWTRVIDKRNARGVSIIDYLAEHGWGPLAKSARTSTDDPIVWLIRDPDELIVSIPPAKHGTKGGYKSVQNDPNVKTVSPQQARGWTEAAAGSLDDGRVLRAKQAAKDATLESQVRQIEVLDEKIAALQQPKVVTRQPKNAAWAKDKNAAFTEEIPLSLLDDVPAGNVLGKTDIDTLAEDIAKNGMREPIQLTYSAKDKAIRLDEGNHRVAAARKLGLEDVPVRVVRVERSLDPPGKPVRGKLPDESGYVPGDMLPSEVMDIPARTKQPHLMQSSTYRQLLAERNELMKATSTRSAQARRDEVMVQQINPGNLVYVKGIEDDLRKYVPNIDMSIAVRMTELAPREAEKLYALEAALRRNGGYYNKAGEWVNGTEYTLKIAPRDATPYYMNLPVLNLDGTTSYISSGEAYQSLMAGRRALQDSIRDRVTSKAGLVTDMLFGRRYARALSGEAKQFIYNDLLNAGATATEANQFIAAARWMWENQPHQFLGAKMRKTVDAMSPNTLNAIARGQALTKPGGRPLFAGFKNEAVYKAIPDFGDLMQRTGSRTFRNLSKKYPATPGSGNLGKLIEQWYGKQPSGKIFGVGKVARRTSFYAAFGYHTLRFMLDPRWYVMNLLEQDWLAMARYGWKVRKGARLRSMREEIKSSMGKPPPARLQESARDIEILAGRKPDSRLLSAEETLHADAMSSGWMDPRNLYGYVRNISREQRPQVTMKLIQKAIDDGSPVIDDLRNTWGANPMKWVDEIEKQLYDIDTKGVRATVMADATAQQMAAATGPVSKYYDDFLDAVFAGHTKSYQDIVHTFHGNINRSNIERLMNSPFLWWPMSYQLKTGKWLIDVMTKQFAGIYGPEMLGTVELAFILSKHKSMMEASEEYAAIFDEHPALWRTLGMLLPITPFDMGAFMARWSRYAGSWVGAQLGVWDQDTSYPQDPVNFVYRSLSLGPVFSADIIEDIYKEFE